MKFTLGKIAEDALCIFWAIIFWLASVIDAAEPLTSASTSPSEAPVVTGPSGRSKTLGRSCKNKVAQLAARGQVFKSGQSVHKGMKLLGLVAGRSDKTGNDWLKHRAFRYIYELQRVDTRKEETQRGKKRKCW